MRLSLHRVGSPRTHGGAAGANTVHGGGAARASVVDIQGERHSSITVVELPGTEHLAEDPSKLRFTENTCVHKARTPYACRQDRFRISLHSRAHRSIKQISEFVRSLSLRSGTEHVWSWGGHTSTGVLDLY